jgi:Pyruvate/2-oxoacid:ferredoxin oxidoreductase delta subunit
VRIHGRGGQAVVTAAELLSLAAFDEGRYDQAFPSFGSERMGAPVVSYGVRPDNAVLKVDEGDGYAFDLDYCKGCGICIVECRAERSK